MQSGKRGYFSKLIGYNGYASIELEVEDHENIREYLRGAVVYLKEVLGLD